MQTGSPQQKPGWPTENPSNQDAIANNAADSARSASSDRTARASTGWLRGLLTAVRYLLPLRRPGGDEIPAAASAVWWFVPIGLLIGITYTIVFRSTWRFWGEYMYLRPLPAVAVLIADVAFFGHRLLRGAVGVVDNAPGAADGRPIDARPATLTLTSLLTVVLVILLKFGLLLSLPVGTLRWPEGLPRLLYFVFPQPIYRPLLLMAVWGRWGVLLAMSLGRTRHDASGTLRTLVARARLGVILVWFLLAAIGTVIYCSRGRNIVVGTVMSCAVLGATYLASVLMAWRFRGQTDASVLAAGLVAELAFLLAYVHYAGFIVVW